MNKPKKKIVKKVSSKIILPRTRCTGCRGFFQEHHHKNITKDGAFHTGCYKKENNNLIKTICNIKDCHHNKTNFSKVYRNIHEDAVSEFLSGGAITEESLHKAKALEVKRKMILQADGEELEKEIWEKLRTGDYSYAMSDKNTGKVTYYPKTRLSLWVRIKNYLCQLLP